jgi:hypothetical protein
MKRSEFPTKTPKDRAAKLALIRSLPEEDFDGHTNFKSLGPEQRLAWLSQSVRFAWEARKTRGASPKK